MFRLLLKSSTYHDQYTFSETTIRVIHLSLVRVIYTNPTNYMLLIEMYSHCFKSSTPICTSWCLMYSVKLHLLTNRCIFRRPKVFVLECVLRYLTKSYVCLVFCVLRGRLHFHQTCNHRERRRLGIISCYKTLART